MPLLPGSLVREAQRRRVTGSYNPPPPPVMESALQWYLQKAHVWENVFSRQPPAVLPPCTQPTIRNAIYLPVPVMTITNWLFL